MPLSQTLIRFCLLFLLTLLADCGRQGLATHRKAAEQGHAEAQFNLGVLYNQGKGIPQDYTEATRWFRKAAEQGHTEAQFNLGILYDKGNGVPQDYTEAIRWYRKAAEQGLAAAQFNLGLLYSNGKGIPQDYTEAARWWRKAAEQGFANAQCFLGVCYDEGRGVPQDYVEAHMWVNLATAGVTGELHKKFAEERDQIAKKMNPQQIAEAQRRAREWKPKAESGAK